MAKVAAAGVKVKAPLTCANCDSELIAAVAMRTTDASACFDAGSFEYHEDPIETESRHPREYMEPPCAAAALDNP